MAGAIFTTTAGVLSRRFLLPAAALVSTGAAAGEPFGGFKG